MHGKIYFTTRLLEKKIVRFGSEIERSKAKPGSALRDAISLKGTLCAGLLLKIILKNRFDKD